MDKFVSAVVTLGVAAVGAAMVFYVVSHPSGTAAAGAAVSGVTNSFFGTLFNPALGNTNGG